MNRNHFVYKLIPPRATFATDMTEVEKTVMAEHAAYWTGLLEAGRVVVFGVVIDQTGAWGLAVVEAEAEDEVRAIGSDDPAVKKHVCTFDVGVMPNAAVRPRQTAA